MSGLTPGVARSLEILHVRRALGLRDWGGPVADAIEKVIQILDELGVSWCLIGAHAVGEFTEPRATTDVDLLVDDRKLGELLGALRTGLGELDDVDIGPAVRLRAIAVDLVRASSNRLFRETISGAVERHGMKLPTREALIALKFMAMVAPFRAQNRRRQDVVDLIALYESAVETELDRAELARLTAMIFPGAETKLSELLRRIDAGEPIQL